MDKMTEQMAIEVLKEVMNDEFQTENQETAYSMAIQALEKQSMVNEILNEIGQYRAIGTVEELQALKEKDEDCIIKHLTGECSYNETGCSGCIGREEIKAALEKSVAKKPIEQGTDDKTIYKCSCGNVLMEKYSDGLICGFITDYCKVCGQKLLRAELDWE